MTPEDKQETQEQREEQPALLEHEADRDQYLHLLPNKPRHVVFCDEAIGMLIRVGKVIKFYIDTPEQSEPMVTVVLKDVNLDTLKTFKGKGPSLGHALREMLDAVNLEYQFEDITTEGSS